MDIEQIAEICHEVNRAYCQTLGEGGQPEWEDAPEWQKESTLHSIAFFLKTPEARPRNLHEAWMKEKQIQGWRYGPVKNPETKEHPCLVDYDHLPEEQKLKDILFLAIVRNLGKSEYRSDACAAWKTSISL